MKKISPLTSLSFLLLVNVFPLHAQWTKPGMLPPAAVVGSEVRTGFVPPEGGFFIGKRIQESLGPVQKAFSLKERAIQRHN